MMQRPITLASLVGFVGIAIVLPALAVTISRLSGSNLWLDLISYQGQLHHRLADALRALRDGSPLHAALVLGGLSLLYGVVLAVGPGHGKAVISSYRVADGGPSEVA